MNKAVMDIKELIMMGVAKRSCSSSKSASTADSIGKFIA